MLFAVVTTIQRPTDCIDRLVERLEVSSSRLVVAGDKKGPDSYVSKNGNELIDFLDLHVQQSGPFEVGRKLPTGHYCRKNVAYLHAIAEGATCIYETDDDNAPLASWGLRLEELDAPRTVAPRKGFDGHSCETVPDADEKPFWVNAYKYFSNELIWPRGLPLDEIRTDPPATVESQSLVRAPIQQGLVNNSPDVDAIWRLAMDRPFDFDDGRSVHLGPGNWCPFNTQSTWWWRVAYPLLYIPSYCSFRMCDIWKSFVAQRCLWAMGYGVAFHAAEVIQERNIHDLMRDFRDEIPGYDQNRQLAECLEALDLKSGTDAVSENLLRCYEAWVRAGIFPKEELDLVQTWVSDLEALAPGGKSDE